MFAKTRTINRQYIGKDIQTVMDVPNLIGIQTSSYESFLQSERLKNGEKLLNQGLQDAAFSYRNSQYGFKSYVPSLSEEESQFMIHVARAAGCDKYVQPHK